MAYRQLYMDTFGIHIWTYMDIWKPFLDIYTQNMGSLIVIHAGIGRPACWTGILHRVGAAWGATIGNIFPLPHVAPQPSQQGYSKLHQLNSWCNSELPMLGPCNHNRVRLCQLGQSHPLLGPVLPQSALPLLQSAILPTFPLHWPP